MAAPFLDKNKCQANKETYQEKINGIRIRKNVQIIHKNMYVNAYMFLWIFIVIYVILDI